jgi:hypothetical protein
MPAPAGATGTTSTSTRALRALTATALTAALTTSLGAALTTALTATARPAFGQTAPAPAVQQATAVTIGVSQASGVYTFTGTLTPAVAGVQVTIARLGTDGRVTGVVSTATTAGGRYEVATSLPVGFASYYALTAATPELQAGRSRLYGLLVNVTPGSTVTPTVSLDVRRGSSTYVFSGQVSPGRAVPLTLARIVDGRAVGVVGTRTGPGGQYAISQAVGPGTHFFQVLTGAANGLTAARSRVYGLVVAGAARPAAVSPVQHGATYFGAYLALGTGSADPRLAAADASARGLGYTPGRTSLDCDRGAARGLGRPEASQEHATVLYFRTEAEARQFTALHPPVEAGVVRVQTFCRD